MRRVQEKWYHNTLILIVLNIPRILCACLLSVISAQCRSTGYGGQIGSWSAGHGKCVIKNSLLYRFYGDKILYKNLKFFDKIFVPRFCRRRFRNALYGEKILLDGEMLCLGTVSTNLARLFYAGKIQNSGNGNVYFLDTVEIYKRRQSCSSTITVQHRHQRMWRFYPRSRIVGG